MLVFKTLESMLKHFSEEVAPTCFGPYVRPS